MRIARAAGAPLPPAAVAFARRVRWWLTCLWASYGMVDKSTDPRWLDVLNDQGFRRSMRAIRDLSALDTPRLANLWQWCGMSEDGALIEVGAFRGGTALHLSNRWPNRRIFVCDTFDGFAPLRFHHEHDQGIRPGTWCNHDAAAVEALFLEKSRDVRLIQGVFPQSDRRGEVRGVSFAHVDVDLYESCIASLEYLAPRTTPGAFIVVNDYLRERTRGIRQAVEEFLAQRPLWIALPVYPGQGLLLNLAAFGERRGFAAFERPVLQSVR
jgi:O-methyltransferase